jgi:hypothetical protein
MALQSRSVLATVASVLVPALWPATVAAQGQPTIPPATAAAPAAPVPVPAPAPVAAVPLAEPAPVVDVPPPPAVAPAPLPPATLDVAPSPPAAAPSEASKGAAPPDDKKVIKGFIIASDDGNWSMKVGAHVQVRLTYERLEVGDPKDKIAFSLPRLRVQLNGTALTKDLGYNLLLSWDNGGIPALRDAFFDYRVHDQVRIRAGQGRKPFDREELTPDSKLEFAERSIVARAFGQGRDLGVTVHNGYDKSPVFEYALGLFNGTSEKTVFTIDDEKDTLSGTNVPTRFHPALVARAGYNHGNIKGYSEADLEGGKLRFAAAAGTRVNFNADNDSTSGLAANVDMMLKAHGVSVTGAVFFAWASSGKFADQEYGGAGFRGQVGYTIAKLVQPAFRYARVMPKGDANDTQELLGTVNFYPYGQDFSVQANGGAILTETATGTTTNGLVRVQGQVAF